MTTNRQWVLQQRPTGPASRDHFRFQEAAVPVPTNGDVLVRTLYVGYDAGQRIWLTEDGGYMAPIGLGQPMRAIGVGQVVASRRDGISEGDIVEGLLSWADYSLVNASSPLPLRLVEQTDLPLTWQLSVFGVSGLTGYFGMTDGLQVEASDTVVVSAASGATGYIAGGVAKALGAAKVIGIAGGPDKCRWLVENAGFDAAIDYRNDDLEQRLVELCPAGVSAYFDNVGGDMLGTLLMRMAPRGRVLISGAMSSGYTDLMAPGPRNFMRICTEMLTVQGFFLGFYQDRFPEGAAALGRLVANGVLPVHETLVDGLETAPDHLPTVFSGKHPGKLILHIADSA